MEHNDALQCISEYTKINYIYIPYNKTWTQTLKLTFRVYISPYLFFNQHVVTKTIVKRLFKGMNLSSALSVGKGQQTTKQFK